MDDFVRKSKRSPLQSVTPRTRPERVQPRSSEVVPAPVPTPDSLPEPDPFLPTPKDKKPGKKARLKLPKPKTKLQWAALCVGMALVLAGTGFLVYSVLFKKEAPPVTYTPPVVEEEPEPEPTTTASRLSGRQLDKNAAVFPIYAVQIENSPEARPQSGLKDADIVSEAVAEGGITRFNAIFHDTAAANIGPVRSLRPYYIDWFLPYKAGIVHAGGSAQALSDINTLNLQDMNHNSTHFRRVSNRYAPHNLYTTGAQMRDLFTSKGYSNAEPVPSLPRKEAKPAETPTANTITLNISSALYNVVFTYDKTTNKYLRAQGGAAHVDAESGQQLAPDVIVVPVISKGKSGIYTTYATTGSGKVYVFQDGIVTEGTWSKSSRDAQWQLTDAAGQPIGLNPGQTWFTMIDSAGSVVIQ